MSRNCNWCDRAFLLFLFRLQDNLIVRRLVYYRVILFFCTYKEREEKLRYIEREFF